MAHVPPQPSHLFSSLSCPLPVKPIDFPICSPTQLSKILRGPSLSADPSLRAPAMPLADDQLPSSTSGWSLLPHNSHVMPHFHGYKSHVQHIDKGLATWQLKRGELFFFLKEKRGGPYRMRKERGTGSFFFGRGRGQKEVVKSERDSSC